MDYFTDLLATFLDMGTFQLCCCLWRVWKFSDSNKNIFICVPTMNKVLTNAFFFNMKYPVRSLFNSLNPHMSNTNSKITTYDLNSVSKVSGSLLHGALDISWWVSTQDKLKTASALTSILCANSSHKCSVSMEKPLCNSVSCTSDWLRLVSLITSQNFSFVFVYTTCCFFFPKHSHTPVDLWVADLCVCLQHVWCVDLRFSHTSLWHVPVILHSGEHVRGLCLSRDNRVFHGLPSSLSKLLLYFSLSTNKQHSLLGLLE